MSNECAVVGCTKPIKSRGWCNAHYTRWLRHGDVGTSGVWDKASRTCSVDGCGRRFERCRREVCRTSPMVTSLRQSISLLQ